MKEIIVSLLFTFAATVVTLAELSEVNLVPQQDMSFLLRRIQRLEQKASIHTNEWNCKISKASDSMYLVFEERGAEGEFTERTRLEAFRALPETDERIWVVFENDKVIGSCSSATECVDHPASLVTFSTRTHSTSAQVFRVVETEYKNTTEGNEGVLCIFKTDKGDVHRLRLISDQSANALIDSD